jgi:hypothetical protein
LREERNRHQDKKLDSPNRWFSWNRLSTIHWRSKLDFVTYIHINDWRTGRRYNYLTYKEFTHSVTVAVISAGLFGIGIGQLFAEIVRR